MKTTMTISIEENIKRDFQEFAKDLWTNVTNLLSMFMRDATKRKQVQFSSISYDMEFKRFSKDNLEELINDKKIKENTLKMEKILSNV